MISLASLAAAAAALAIGGTGSAALVMAAPPTKADVAASITARAHADLSAAEEAHKLAVAALSKATAEGKAEAKAQIEAGTASLEKASMEMKTAVNTGSKVAVDAFAEFTRKSVRLVNALSGTASATVTASVQAGGNVVKAVDTQIATARGIATAQGTAAVAALTQVKADLPLAITGLVQSTTTVSPAVPEVPARAQVNAGAQSSTSVAGLPLGVVSSTTGQLGVNLGG